MNAANQTNSSNNIITVYHLLLINIKLKNIRTFFFAQSFAASSNSFHSSFRYHSSACWLIHESTSIFFQFIHSQFAFCSFTSTFILQLSFIQSICLYSSPFINSPQVGCSSNQLFGLMDELANNQFLVMFSQISLCPTTFS